MNRARRLFNSNPPAGATAASSDIISRLHHLPWSTFVVAVPSAHTFRSSCSSAFPPRWQAGPPPSTRARAQTARTRLPTLRIRPPAKFHVTLPPPLDALPQPFSARWEAYANRPFRATACGSSPAAAQSLAHPRSAQRSERIQSFCRGPWISSSPCASG